MKHIFIPATFVLALMISPLSAQDISTPTQNKEALEQPIEQVPNTYIETQQTITSNKKTIKSKIISDITGATVGYIGGNLAAKLTNYILMNFLLNISFNTILHHQLYPVLGYFRFTLNAFTTWFIAEKIAQGCDELEIPVNRGIIHCTAQLRSAQTLDKYITTLDKAAAIFNRAVRATTAQVRVNN